MKKIFILSIFIISIFFFLYNKRTKNIEFNTNIFLCNNCKMTISNELFKFQIIDKKKKIYKFDDINCMINYIKEKKINIESVYGKDYYNNKWININDSVFIIDNKIKTPMNSKMILSKKIEDNEDIKIKNYKEITTLNQLLNEE